MVIPPVHKVQICGLFRLFITIFLYLRSYHDFSFMFMSFLPDISRILLH
ncbi:hypothetical protein CLOSTHATH_02730 [Hungatella hathewayi DSM 13479]|uniref:Uncharacterized protein n=1 Tax=Hungatella hathewayi DSM 13479 TaxID=566550 RepID=D3AGJ4_9FIRM|nr:hypothetical protein CLOSTHATH_02730 [Hungatella hathewayi DSM 13479]